MNTLNKNFDNLVYLLKCTSKTFDLIAVSETRISKKTSVISNVNLNNYSFESTTAESSAGGTMLYISNHLSYEPRNDLNMCKTNLLESTFIEINNSKKSNIIVSCVYKHPNVDVLDFNYLINQLFDKISKEQKQIFLLRDFNINLSDYNNHQPTNTFLDFLASNSIIPYMLQPTRLTSHSKTLIDNIFSNVRLWEAISGNITATSSDHLPQFLFVPNVFSNPLCNKSNILERDWPKFNKEKFILDYFNKNWSVILQLYQHNVNLSMDSYLDQMNAILDIHAPYKRVNKCKLRLRLEPSITPALQKPISVKNSHLKKLINCNDSQTKEHLHTRYKEYRNLLSTLSKRSKTNYYSHYFDINCNNVTITWKGIKSMLSIKFNPSDIPKILNKNDSTITNPVEIAKVFNNYFSCIASQTKVNIKYSHKHFSDFLTDMK